MGRKSLIVMVVVVVVGMAAVLAVAVTVQHQSGTATCRQTGTVHTVVFQDNKMIPNHISGKLCDQMTVINRDKVAREVAFGPHEHHTPYDGVTERVLDQNQSLTITFDRAGTYDFHDHFHDELTGTFTVSQ